ncbi:MAG: DUF2007 domain-containing protein [Alphaproteobacteria bacterium]|nr:DUF2007 domain-containing protein [Alphaproteobacteria bacterium]
MRELLRSNDPVLLSWIQAVLAAEHIDCLVFDSHASIIEGSISAIPRRIMVAEEDHHRACWVLNAARPGIVPDPDSSRA